jgi:hypothetical protein
MVAAMTAAMVLVVVVVPTIQAGETVAGERRVQLPRRLSSPATLLSLHCDNVIDQKTITPAEGRR